MWNNTEDESFTNSSQAQIFNFNMSIAKLILEEHMSNYRVFQRYMQLFIMLCYIILMITGVCANLFVLLVILCIRRARTERNLFILNLNISDITLCLFCMPFTLLELMYKNWFLGQFMCKLVPFIQATSVFVSAVTVSAIAIDRKRTIVTLLPHKMNIDHKLTRYTIGIWFISLLLSLPISFTKKVTAVGLPGYIMYYKCIEKWPSVNSRITYMLVTSLAQFLIPMTILLVTHLRIKSHLTCSENKNFKMQKVLWRNRRITMMLMNVSIVYTISWLPWNGFNIIADFNPHIMTTQNLYLGFAVCHLIAMTSSTTNPIFYGWLNTNIQREWIHIIRKIHRNLWTHSADITSTKQMDLKSEPS